MSHASPRCARQMTSAGSFPPEWQAPPQNLSLPHHEMHVWVVSLDQSSSALANLLVTLSPEEQARARRFHSLRDCDRYVIAHFALRDILGRYSRLAPSDVRLDVMPNGKPVLASASRDHHLEFNMSHSYDLALIAVGRGRQLGVDVERICSQMSEEAIAEQFFSPQEAASLRSLPPDARLAAFFAGWTRKEAYSKARGDGLWKPLGQFAVVMTPGQPAALVYDQSDPQAASRWSLRPLDVGPAYAAAVAVEGRQWRLRQWLWQTPTYPQ
jgi:4'-phosphopantetheinyl transferase